MCSHTKLYKLKNCRKFVIFLLIVSEVTCNLVTVRQFSVVTVTLSIVECLNVLFVHSHYSLFIVAPIVCVGFVLGLAWCPFCVGNNLTEEERTCLYFSLVATKPVFQVSDKVRFKPACSATETS